MTIMPNLNSKFLASVILAAMGAPLLAIDPQTHSFDFDPKWDGFRNRLVVEPIPLAPLLMSVHPLV